MREWGRIEWEYESVCLREEYSALFIEVDGGIDGPKSMACKRKKNLQQPASRIVWKGNKSNVWKVVAMAAPELVEEGENLSFLSNTHAIYIIIPDILQKIRDKKKKRENPGFHIGCNALELV